jgi:hypothetical protein
LTRRRALGRTAVVLGIIVVMVVAAIGVLVIANQVNPGGPVRLHTQSSTTGPPSTTSTGTNTSCVITGQPGGAYLRILSDSTLTPVTGAVVTAEHRPAACALNGVEYTNTATNMTFTTNGTEWMSLDTTNDGSYSFTVQYSGHTYAFTAGLGPLATTCATLYVPSGRTNVTSGLGTCSNQGQSSTSSTTIVQSSAGCPSNATCGSITYASAGQVLVEYVQTTRFVCQGCGAVNGQSYVGFAVTFENAGNSPIYIPAGTTGVSTSVPPDSILQRVTTLICPGFFAIDKLDPGQNYTLYGPSCDDGYEYQLVQPGKVTVTFSFDWTTNSTASSYPTDFPNSTTISAQFVFASP